MKNKNIGIRIIIVIGIVLILILIIQYIQPAQSVSWKKAMQIYGCIPYIEDETVATFAVITSKDIVLAEDICSLSFPETNVKTSNVSCREVFSNEKGILWLIDAELDVELPCNQEEIDITRMVYNQEEYEIGQLRLLILPEGKYEHGVLELKSNSGASIGKGLKPYHAEFENVGSDIVQTYDMIFPMYDNVVNDYQVDNNSNKDAILSGSHLYIEADFSDCTNLGQADCFYVTPILTYEYQGEQHCEFKPYYTAGFFLSEEDVAYYIDRFTGTS